MEDVEYASSVAFDIVLEAKVRTIVKQVKKYRPNCTLEQLIDRVNRWITDEWKSA
jgi:hypothetical protein